MESKFNFIEMEHNVLKFWESQQCFEMLREKNKGKKLFRFLDGPITANNSMGIHHAWGRSVKDIILRYKAMNGYDCLYRNGFDTQGLWVEVEVEKELGFKDKKDIEAYGMDNFTKKCVERITRFSKIIETQSKRLGQWMDWNNSYFTHTDENISAIWHFLKICHDNNWIIKANRPMPWCPRCGTSLSEHEMSGSHVEITHTAVFVKAKVINKDFDLLVWTTTPWTLAANTALAVNPELDYAFVECGYNRPLVLAKSMLKVLEGNIQVLKIIKGSELTGLEYETFFPFLPVQQGLTHKIIPWEDVDASEGSGIVHIAPGCGAQDYELGKKYALTEICPIDENGVFTEEFDFLSGKPASQAAEAVFVKLQEQGKLYKTHNCTHSYPVCWRCKTEVLFRLVKEWYIKTDEIRPKLIKAAESVKWEPAFIGKRMHDWLTNMGDWNISRKRFYGLPLPFYPCKNCGKLTVVGSKEELLDLSGKNDGFPHEMHRPWIDEIKIICPGCGAEVERVPEVGDVWLDAGIVPFSTLGYFTDKVAWEKNFPAEWVIEMQEQVRLWFYSQLFMSVAITGRAPYERVMTNNWVLAEDGSKFSKTGYMIPFDEAAEKIGSDAIRYLFAGAPTSGDVRFGLSLGEFARRRLLGFWNIYTFFVTYAEIDKPAITNVQSDNIMDIWLTARVNDFVEKSTEHYNKYNLCELIREFELCVDDISNWYVRANRRRFWKDIFDTDKSNAYNSLYYTVKTLTMVMAPVIPFMCEYIWQNMILKYGFGEKSVHLSDFPKPTGKDEKALRDTEKVRAVIAHTLSLRNEKNIKIKQPLSVLYLEDTLKQVCTLYQEVIREELNIKKIVYLSDFNSLVTQYLSLNFQKAGKYLKDNLNQVKEQLNKLTDKEMANCVLEYKKGSDINLYRNSYPVEIFNLELKEKEYIAKSKSGIQLAINTNITQELKEEGICREILRHCQVLRKEAGLAVSDRALLDFETQSEDLIAIINKFNNQIARETLSDIKSTKLPVSQKDVKINGFELTIKIGLAQTCNLS